MNVSRDEVLAQLRQMDEYEFEYLIAEVWSQRGWETTVTAGSSDRGVDVIAEKNSPFTQKHLIQAKRYSEGNKIGGPDIQQYSSLRHQEKGVDAVVVVTTSSFSAQAKQRANELNVKLVNGGSLAEMIVGLESQEFLTDYFDTETATTRKGSSSLSSNQNRIGQTKGQARNSSATEPTPIPDNFHKSTKTSELGTFCPICGGKNTVWKGKTVNTDPMLVCEECGTKWSKEVKDPLLFGSKRIWWTAIGKDMKKEPSEWKEMNPNRSR